MVEAKPTQLHFEPLEHLKSVSKTIDSDMYSNMGRRPARPLDDSEEEGSSSLGAQVVPDYDVAMDMMSSQKDQESIFQEDTTTTTTTITTARIHKRVSLKDGLEGLVAHHQDVHTRHQQQALAPSDESLSQITTEESSLLLEQGHNMAIRSPTESKTKQSLSVSTSSTSASAALQKQLDHHHNTLSDSSNSSSVESTESSPGPNTPTSVDAYNTISITSVATKKKRRVRLPTFEARPSALDPETLSKTLNPFRGFHNLFWLIMGAYGILTFDAEWTRVGKVFGGSLFSSFSQDAIMLAISDFFLVSATGIAFLLIKAISKGWLRYKVAGMVVQHSVQALFLLSAIIWTLWRQWPWVQSGFFTLHAITMLMKIHSYIAFNGELSEKLIQLKTYEATYAEIKGNDACSADGNSSSRDTRDTSGLHHRLTSQTETAPLQGSVPNAAAIDAGLLASEIDELKNDLRCQSGELWPANVTIANFVDYLIIPTLIYELQYPRTSRIRPKYVFEKVVATFGTFTLLYLTTEHYIYPVVLDPTISPLKALKLLLIPFMMNYLLIFYIIFECICNAFAELSCFADRNFYDDWWNCTNLDEWARKWNKPVHNFLLHHVYFSSIESFHLSKANAAMATFFLSSCVHELVMMIVTRKVRMYLFVLQMGQLPLIWLGHRQVIRENPRLANVLFWAGMFSGPPLLGVAYCYA
ncbi:hypothetical protein BGX21_005514 [Mortierella sp. AD011]|nr:hypothetical protein BGX20_004656 [Mortierella sp. AD010]KAF9403307.1 hypothetical protein BGX21_005514 [Mortierella sp. AD011]